MDPKSDQKILVVGNFNRNDFLAYFRNLKDRYSLYFLEFMNEQEVLNPSVNEYGDPIFWKNFNDAFELLDTIRPFRVIYFFIESYNHVALNVACKLRNITTVHLEHGIRDYDRILNLEKYAISNESPTSYSIIRKLFKEPLSLWYRFKTRKFFLQTKDKCPKEAKTFLAEYFDIRSSNSIFSTFSKVKSKYRIADHYISFSEKVFHFHQISDHLNSDQSVFFIGIPFFDEFANLEISNPKDEHLIFVDQPFPEQNLFGWSQEFRKQLIDEINFKILKGTSCKLMIKMHPLSDSESWNTICKEYEQVELIPEFKLLEMLSNSKIIIGFASTLLLPMIAQPHTICFSLTIHPEKNDQYSALLTDSNAIMKIDSIDELDAALKELPLILEDQSQHKQEFIKDWMYNFDGNSLERFQKILLDEIT